jgi:hypothetical protein
MKVEDIINLLNNPLPPKGEATYKDLSDHDYIMMIYLAVNQAEKGDTKMIKSLANILKLAASLSPEIKF